MQKNEPAPDGGPAPKGRRRALKLIAGSVFGILLSGVGAILVWSQVGVMPAESEPLAAVRENTAIAIDDAPQGIVLTPADGESDRGLVFVPGAKVDPWAYASILQGLAEDGEMIEIDGASHASFGDYGPQAGDSSPTISDSDMHARISQVLQPFFADLGGR